MFLSFTVTLLLAFGKTDAFFPNRFSNVVVGQATFTHQEISEIGILKAIAAFFEDNPRNDSKLAPGQLTEMKNITAMKLFKLYYGDDLSGSKTQDVINSIVAANNLVYRDQYLEAVWHCNGETIREANNKMIDLREQLIEVLLEETPNFDLARELIGQFLHIMQMFYSNTNWVEMFGSDAYYTLGIRNKPLLPQASSIMETCRSCGNLVGTTCNTTLRGVDELILTSGYRSGQDVEKPFRNPDDFTKGKCSHGGPFDSSGVTAAALGGINKDSVRPFLSPHYYLHQAAAQAAINHTTYFFNDEEYGLLHKIGQDKYVKLFQLKQGSSLVFTIDSTGSMGSSIIAVKEQVIMATKKYAGAVSNFIVTLFNDPANLTTVFQSEDSEETIRYVEKIRVQGGGDCPEYSMDGIIKASQASHPNSIMHIFTDASAKDSERSYEVISLLAEKNLIPEFLLTGDCGRKRRHASGSNTRSKRSTDGIDLYRAIAGATGGSVYVTTKGSISQLANIIQESVMASVTILKRNLASTESSDININVDNTVQQLIIEITGNGTLRETLYDPSGIAQTTNANVTDIGVGKLIKFNNPAPGVWRLTRLDSNSWTMKVTAQSSLDITSRFVQMDPVTGFEYDIIGRPVAGEKAVVVMLVPSEELISTLDRIQLTDSDGMELAQYDNITRIKGPGASLMFKVQFPLPTKDFQVTVSGQDTNGNRYTRLQNKKIVPVAIQLYLLPINETLFVNEMLTINFVVVNKGGSASTITVTISDDQNFAQSPLQRQYSLDPNQNATGQFTLLSGPTPGVITTVTVSANTASSTGELSQFAIRRISSQKKVIRPVDNTLPFCNITLITGSCDVENLDSCTCSQHKWSGSADIGDEGFGLYRITSSVKDAVSFSHDPFTAGHTINNGTIRATIKSDCCNPEVYITIVDMASNTGQCLFDLAPELDTPFPECKPIPTEPTPPTLLFGQPLYIIVAVAGVGALVIIVIIVVIICVVARSKKTKKQQNYKNEN